MSVQGTGLKKMQSVQDTLTDIQPQGVLVNPAEWI